MTSGQADAASSMLPDGRFSGRSEFAELVRQAMTAAAAQGWREMIWCDPDFADWPLGERAVMQALNDWAGSGRKLTLLADHYDAVLRKHARFVTWRGTWAHVIACRKSGAASAGCLPSALWSQAWVFERLDITRGTGVASANTARCNAVKERLNEHLLTSSAGFPATILGL